MPDYSKLRDLLSHRVAVEYDTGARVVGYLAQCLPSDGPVEFVKLANAQLVDSKGNILFELKELALCPNVLTGVSLDEGPRGREVERRRSV